MRKKRFTNYKFRCSGLGNLMVNPKKKDEVLSETTKTYLRDIYISEVYGRHRDIANKYIEKGLIVEEDSLTLLQKYYKKLLIKNKKHFENDYIKGTPDLLTPKKVIESKSSWDIWTFFKTDGTNIDYYWQRMGYMDLTNRKYADLAYCLVNTPEYLIVQEKTKQMYKLGTEHGTVEMSELETEIDKNMTFDDIPASKRIRIYKLPFVQSEIEKLYNRIEVARDYLNSLNF